MDIIISLIIVLVILSISNFVLILLNNKCKNSQLHENRIINKFNPENITKEQINGLSNIRKLAKSKYVNTAGENKNDTTNESLNTKMDKEASDIINNTFNVILGEQSDTIKQESSISGNSAALFEVEFEGLRAPIYKKKMSYNVLRSNERDGYS